MRENTFDFITFEEVVLEQVYSAIPAHLPQCDRIIDLGANIGLASLYLAACYPSCKIVAVEPFAKNYALLTKNIGHLIEVGRCIPLQAALWGSEKSLVIEQPAVANRYNAITVRESLPNEETESMVEGLPLRKIIERSGFPEVDMLKVDIEGAETELFKGDLAWLDLVAAIAIEFHGNSRMDSDFDHIMKQYHFEIRSENDHTVLAIRATKTNSNVRLHAVQVT